MKRRREERVLPAARQNNPDMIGLAEKAQVAVIDVLMQADPSGSIARALLENLLQSVDELSVKDPQEQVAPIPKDILDYRNFAKRIAVGLEQEEGLRLRIMSVIEQRMLPWYLSCYMDYSYDYKQFDINIRPNDNRLKMTKKQSVYPYFSITFEQYAELQTVTSDDELFEHLYAIIKENKPKFFDELMKLTREVANGEREAILEKERKAKEWSQW